MATSIPLDQIKVLLLENIHPSAEEYFKKQGFNVTRLAHALSEDQLIEQAKDVHLIGIRSKTHLTERFLRSTKHLWAIGCFCIGTNQVDLECATDLGIPVFNSPFQNTRSVAELVISETIALHRRLFDKSQMMHAGAWQIGSGAQDRASWVTDIGSQVSACRVWACQCNIMTSSMCCPWVTPEALPH